MANGLKILRNTKDLSQVALGKLLGVSSAAVCFYETGQRNPSSTVISKMAKIFQLDYESMRNIFKN